MASEHPAPRKRAGLWGLILIAAICLPLIGVMIQNVVRDLGVLRSASSDSLLWTLSQSEIEFLEFQRAVELRATETPPDLEELRKEFDIFYGRISIVENSAGYAPLRDNPSFAGAVSEVRGFLDRAVPLVDGPDAALAAAVRDWPDEIAPLRDATRQMSTVGVSHFASISNAFRDSIGQTLLRVALLTTALMAAMVVAMVYLRRVTRQTEVRGQQLGSANARLNTILDTTLDGIVVADSDGHILQFNAAAEAMFKRTAAEVGGRRLGTLLVMPEDAGGSLQGLVGKGRIRMDGVRPDASTFPIEIALATAEANGDDILIGSLRDISLSLAAERELLAAHDRAIAMEKTKSDFLAVMTHEIRTPLNGILGNLGLLEGSQLDADQARYLRNMRISGDILMQHVDAVMDISRLESQKAPRMTVPVHLGRLVQDVVDGQSGAALARSNRLAWSWVGAPVDWVRADAGRIQQILLNLVGNAIKFTRDGRIDIEVEAQRRPGDARLFDIELRVIDTGIGIASDARDTVFEDFETTDTSYGRMAGGTGLGLGIARRLAHFMGGEIGVESTLGEGSVFWVSLPLPGSDAPEVLTRVEAAAAATRPMHILIVEDNEINLELVQDMLRVLGHSTTAAVHGRAALELAAARRFDLILMDISMPVMDGFEATQRIRATPGPCADVPIVALSANVLAYNQTNFAQAGMSGFLGKPFSKAELMAVLAEHAPDPAPPDLSGLPPAMPTGPDEAVVARLQDSFAREVDALIDWLETGPEDRDEIGARCHRIAGTAAVFDAISLRDALIRVEEVALFGGDMHLDRHTRALRQVWRAILAETEAGRVLAS
ncbi:hybrid sensor histidine kinase/response regulator [Roseivivax sp. CAU 1753]